MNAAKFVTLNLFSLLFFLFSACQESTAPVSFEPPIEEEVISDGSYPGVSPALWPFFARFEEEAVRRGFEINLVAEGVAGVFEVIDQGSVVGQCNYYSHRPNRVLIDQTFWNKCH